MKRSAVTDGGSAVLAGLLLWGAATGVESFLETGPMASALLEELGKALLLLTFGWWGQGTAREGHPQARRRALGLARGLSLGLVAVTVFAGTENMAFLIAFQDAGILARLLWSLPVHLVAALLEALGVILLVRCVEGKLGFSSRIVGAFLWFSSLGLACAWHMAANALASVRLTPAAFASGAAIANLLFLVLMPQFLKQAYLGGFLHGAE